MEQGNDSVEDFYKKLREYAKLFGWDKENCKFQFIRELSSANQLEVRLYGLDFPLNELVDRLVKLEALERHSGQFIFLIKDSIQHIIQTIYDAFKHF